jgi:hypothetical protein
MRRTIAVLAVGVTLGFFAATLAQSTAHARAQPGRLRLVTPTPNGVVMLQAPATGTCFIAVSGGGIIEVSPAICR